MQPGVAEKTIRRLRIQFIIAHLSRKNHKPKQVGASIAKSVSAAIVLAAGIYSPPFLFCTGKAQTDGLTKQAYSPWLQP